MEFIGQKVMHKTLGQGEITWFGGKEQNDNKYIKVQFATKSIELQYPAAFKKHLTALNPEFIDVVKKDIVNEKPLLIDENISVNSSLIKTHSHQKHSSISYCRFNKFTFKNEIGYNKKKNKTGFRTFDEFGRDVGVTFMNDDERKPSYGQAEICFYDEYKEDFGQWRLISIGKIRLSFKRLKSILLQQGSFVTMIDPRKGS